MNGGGERKHKQEKKNPRTHMKSRVCSFTQELHPAVFLAVPLSGSDLHHSMNKAAEGGGEGEGAGAGCGERGETLVNPEK